MSDDTKQQPAPADLARELIRLREAAYQGPVAAWAMEATASNNWAGNALLAGLPRPSIDKTPGFTEGDAVFIAAAFAHARTIAEALLAAEETIAKQHRSRVRHMLTICRCESCEPCRDIAEIPRSALVMLDESRRDGQAAEEHGAEVARLARDKSRSSHRARPRGRAADGGRRIMTATTTHVVGPQVRFSKLDRVIQRCAVCGEKLDDYRPSRIAIVSTDGDCSLPSFAEARLLRVTEGNPKSLVDVGDFINDPLPDDFCLSLVEGS